MAGRPKMILIAPAAAAAGYPVGVLIILAISQFLQATAPVAVALLLLLVQLVCFSAGFTYRWSRMKSEKRRVGPLLLMLGQVGAVILWTIVLSRPIHAAIASLPETVVGPPM